jgi:DNA-binding NtrC family response regulator
MGTVLVIDDDRQMRGALATFLTKAGHRVLEAGNCSEGRALQTNEEPDLIIVDYHLPDGNAFDILSAAREREAGEAIIVLTGLGTIDLAVRAIKSGAEHFLTKPVDLESLDVLVRRTLEAQRERRRAVASASADAERRSSPFVGQSAAILALQEIASAVRDSQLPVLILGETGTGKGVLARHLHAQSPRARQPFVDLNCAGLSRELLESELFGHRRGAFTGAVNSKPGLFEIAHGGTLFLDEIGDLELSVQPKLLKVLEEGTFRRLGDVANRAADVRLIAATHRNLGALVKQERFRQDLLFRVNTLVFELPPLRERSEDIEPLANSLLDAFGRRTGGARPRLTAEALEILRRYPWPGNIRELRNVLERALLFCREGVLDRKALRFDRSLDPGDSEDGETDDGAQTLEDAERRHIARVLRRAGGRVDRAAEVLDLSRSSLYAKLKKYGIKTDGAG